MNKKSNNRTYTITYKNGDKFCNFDIKNPKIRYFKSYYENDNYIEVYAVFPDGTWAFNGNAINRWLHISGMSWEAYKSMYTKHKRIPITYKEIFAELL